MNYEHRPAVRRIVCMQKSFHLHVHLHSSFAAVGWQLCHRCHSLSMDAWSSQVSQFGRLFLVLWKDFLRKTFRFGRTCDFFVEMQTKKSVELPIKWTIWKIFPFLIGLLSLLFNLRMSKLSVSLVLVLRNWGGGWSRLGVCFLRYGHGWLGFGLVQNPLKKSVELPIKWTIWKIFPFLIGLLSLLFNLRMSKLSVSLVLVLRNWKNPLNSLLNELFGKSSPFWLVCFLSYLI